MELRQFVTAEPLGERVRQGGFQGGAHHEQFRGRGLHPRRAGQGHRPAGEVELRDAGVLNDLPRALDMLGEHVGRVVENEEYLRAVFHRLPDRADDRGGLAAFGNRHQDVALLQPGLAGLLPSETAWSSKFSTERMRAKSPPVMMLVARSSRSGSLAAMSGCCRWRSAKNSRHAASRRMLKRPVAPQPEKQICPSPASCPPHGGDHPLVLWSGEDFSRLGRECLRRPIAACGLRPASRAGKSPPCRGSWDWTVRWAARPGGIASPAR